MAKFTIEQWKCDRCGVVHDKWNRPVPYIEVAICEDYDVGPGPRAIWKEMCDECTREVRAEFVAMLNSAEAARKSHSPSPTPQVQAQ